MHGVRVELLQRQAVGLPLEIVLIPEMPTMEVYERWNDTLTKLRSVKHTPFWRYFSKQIYVNTEKN
jgi:hypothetical protein